MEWLLTMKLKYMMLLLFMMLLVIFGFVWVFLVDLADLEKHHHYATRHVTDDTYDEHPENLLENMDETAYYQGKEDRLTELDDGNFHDFQVDRIVSPVKNAFKHAEENKIPFILWWTPFTGEQGRIKRCWEGECIFSQNRSYQNHSLTQAFLFYGTDFNENDIPLPRKAHHEWGLLHEESPKNNALLFHEDTLELFNHTSTFKQESSYPISTQYVNSASYILKPLKYTVQEKNKMKEENRFASVLFIQSGCNPPSDRDSYVQELMKFVKIDSYGKCLHNKDLPKEYQNPLTMQNKGFIEFLQKYKFILSFENAICNDYMTEKIFRAIHVGAIPIYRGAPNILDWLPNDHSVILVDDFTTPKDLADYIKHVDETPEEYEKYLEYKKTGITNIKLNDTLNQRQWGVNEIYQMSFITGFECHVCDQIHRNKKLVEEGKKTIQHIASVDHYGCPAPKKYDLPSIPDAEDWERDTWLWEYQDGARKAKALKEKVLKSVEK